MLSHVTDIIVNDDFIEIDRIEAWLNDLPSFISLDSYLFKAIQKKNLEVFKLLVKHGANYNAFDPGGFSVIHCAAIESAESILTYLVKELNIWLEMQAQDAFSETPFLIIARSRKNKVDLLKKLIAWGAYSNACDSNGEYAIHGLSEEGHSDNLKYLVNELKVDVDKKTNINQKTLFFLAAGYGNLPLIKTLVELKANHDIPDVEGLFPIHAAAAKGKNEVIRYLIEEARIPLNLSTRARNRFSVLGCAIINGQIKTAKLLLSLGATLFDSELAYITQVLVRDENIPPLIWLSENSHQAYLAVLNALSKTFKLSVAIALYHPLMLSDIYRLYKEIPAKLLFCMLSHDPKPEFLLKYLSIKTLTKFDSEDKDCLALATAQHHFLFKSQTLYDETNQISQVVKMMNQMLGIQKNFILYRFPKDIFDYFFSFLDEFPLLKTKPSDIYQALLAPKIEAKEIKHASANRNRAVFFNKLSKIISEKKGVDFYLHKIQLK